MRLCGLGFFQNTSRLRITISDARLQALDTKHYQELEDAKAENESLRRSYSDADNERRRLRIEVDTSAETGVSDFNYIDYVAVFGTENALQPAVRGDPPAK